MGRLRAQGWLVVTIVAAALAVGAFIRPSKSRACGYTRVHGAVAAHGGSMLALDYGYGPSDRTGGLLISTDGGARWGVLCAAMIGDQDVRLRGSAVAARGGQLVVQSEDTLFFSDAIGCDWRRDDTFEGRVILDVAVHPSDDDVLYALVMTPGTGSDSSMVRSTSFREWATLSTYRSWIATDLRLVGTDAGLRVYQTAYQQTDGGIVEAIRVSDDGGRTFRRFILHGERPELLGVDPTDPDRIVVATYSDDGRKIRVSDDRGRTFRDYLTVRCLNGFAFGPEGQVYIADARQRELWTARSLDTAPSRLDGDTLFTCLYHDAATDTLYGCTALGFGRLDPRTGEIDSLLDFANLEPFAACPEPDFVSTCERRLCREGCPYCSLTMYGTAPLCQAACDGEGDGVRVLEPPRPIDDGAPPAVRPLRSSGEERAHHTSDVVAGPLDGGSAEDAAGASPYGCSVVAAGIRAADPLWILAALLSIVRRKRRFSGTAADTVVR